MNSHSPLVTPSMIPASRNSSSSASSPPVAENPLSETPENAPLSFKNSLKELEEPDLSQEVLTESLELIIEDTVEVSLENQPLIDSPDVSLESLENDPDTLLAGYSLINTPIAANEKLVPLENTFAKSHQHSLQEAVITDKRVISADITDNVNYRSVETTVNKGLPIDTQVTSPSKQPFAGILLSSNSKAEVQLDATKSIIEHSSQSLNYSAPDKSSVNTVLPPTLQSASPIIDRPTMSQAPLTITTPFAKNDWGDIVADKVMWMSAKGIKEALIQMDPPELGPLNVKISITADQAQVSFSVNNASVKEALDQSALKLREMFAEEGLNLTDVDVSDQSQQQGHSESGDEDQFSQADWNDTTEDSVESHIKHPSQPLYLIDSYV